MAKKITSEQKKENKEKANKNIINMTQNEIVDIIKNNVGHFSNKYTNTKSSVYLLKENGFKTNLPYLSLSSLGLSHEDLFLTSVAKQISKFNVIKTFLINDPEKIKLLDNSEILSEKFGEYFQENGIVNKTLNESVNIEKDLDTYCKQLLVFDENENDYVSLTPLSSLYLNKKLKEALLNKVEKIKETVPEDEKDKVRQFWETVNLGIGGANPQNVGIDASFNLANYFCLLNRNPKIQKNKDYGFLYYLHNGIACSFNQNDLNSLNILVKNYNNVKNIDTKKYMIDKLTEIVNKHIRRCLFIKSKLNEIILKCFEQQSIKDLEESDGEFNDPLNDLFKIKNARIKDVIFNGKIQDLELNTENKLNLTCKFKDYANILASDFVKSLIISNKQNIFNFNEEINSLFTKEVRKIYEQC